MAIASLVWDISNMADSNKRQAAAEGARAIYDSLMERRPAALSNNEWAIRAGVNSSFFTALRKGSEPSVGNLRRVLTAIGLTLPEFFVDEARGKLVAPITRQALERALQEALPGLPRNNDRRASYLAEVVLSVAALPQTVQASASSPDDRGEAEQERERETQVATTSTVLHQSHNRKSMAVSRGS